MKNILASFVLLISCSVLAQTAPAKPAPAKTPSSTATNSGEKELLLAKAWSMVKYEQFSVETPAAGKQKDDGVTFVADGTAFLIIDGVQKTGTWVLDKPKTNVTITIDGGTEKYKFKILSLTADLFVYEYQDPELIRTKYTCAPKKAK